MNAAAQSYKWKLKVGVDKTRKPVQPALPKQKKTELGRIWAVFRIRGSVLRVYVSIHGPVRSNKIEPRVTEPTRN
jgi:hypothetical protein